MNEDKIQHQDVDEEETSDSSESEEEAPEVDEDFLKTLSLLKSKDPKIYKSDQQFFRENVKEETKNISDRKSRPVHIKKFERDCLLKRDSPETDSRDSFRGGALCERARQEIVQSFNVHEEDSEDDNDLLQVKRSITATGDENEPKYIQWLKGTNSDFAKESSSKDLRYLHDYWNDPNLNTDEQFLKDYLLNSKRILKDEPKLFKRMKKFAKDVDDLSDDEKTLDTQASFEHKYNFRYEEPDDDFIKQFPRTIGDSMRRKSNKRKSKRERYQQRKHQEKEQKKEEIKRLKAEKRREIESKLSRLREVTGNDKLGFEDLDVDGDFDAGEHDRKMEQLFDEEYYKNGEGDANDEDWKVVKENNDGGDGPHCEDPDFNMDAEYQASECKSKFATAVSRKKPLFNPEVKSFDEYFDEYYKLDYEDIIDDLPVRFKYRKVVPNDFGLTVEEILNADDKDLHRWCSLAKACQYRTHQEELADIEEYKRKARNRRRKAKIVLPCKSDAEKGRKEKAAKLQISEESVKPCSSSDRGVFEKRPTKRPSNFKPQVSDSRLKSYGINPNKYNKRQRYLKRK